MGAKRMLFVDGENLTIQAQDLQQKEHFSLKPGHFYRENVFVWFPETFHQTACPDLGIWHDIYVAGPPIRSTYYTSAVGDEQCIEGIRAALWNLNFNPEVFPKKKDQKAKGVDISLTKDMLSHAFLGNYDIAILVAGDGDYVPLAPIISFKILADCRENFWK
jgi:uncharacterized LabA/DUF88 family protein